MHVTLKQFVGAPIRDHTTRDVIGYVRDIIINPENSEIVGLFLDAKRTLVIPTIDIVRINEHGLWVRDGEAIVAADDIVRIRDIITEDVPIVKNRVFTVGRHYLGIVVDVIIDIKNWVVIKLDVGKPILGITTERHLIGVNHIVRITKNEITVHDADVRNHATKATLTMPAAECATHLTSTDLR